VESSLQSMIVIDLLRRAAFTMDTVPKKLDSGFMINGMPLLCWRSHLSESGWMHST
jgi:hypothetical protein